jgi:hypothetical protein
MKLPSLFIIWLSLERQKKVQNKTKTKDHEQNIATMKAIKSKLFLLFFSFTIVAADARIKRQDDDDNAEQNVEELCQDRPGDEYFRLSADGDCRDVVR